MPRGKRKISATKLNESSDEEMASVERNEPKNKKAKTTGNNAGKQKTKSRKKGKEIMCDVKEILSLRLSPYSSSIVLEVLVHWAGAGASANTWENCVDTLRYNSVFQNYINSNFKLYETEIYITIANMKESVKNRIRKIYSDFAKWYIMHEIVQPFDPFEYKAHQVFHHMLKDNERFKKSDKFAEFTEFLEQLVIKNYFFKMEEIQRANANKLAARMSELEKINVLIDNDEDFEPPPEFEYVTKNMLIDDVENTVFELPDPTAVKGCKCTSCGPNSQCCPQLIKELFAYKEIAKKPRIILEQQETIIECNDNCKCNINCINRVTQQPRELTLSLFKTKDCGWGVRNADHKAVIKRGSFILEYSGELMGHHEASKREVHSYLFDLNMDRKTDGYYTIDAYKFGNLARFVNHSCEPNCTIWFINDCVRDPKNQKLCIFADKDIAFNEEITIDYCPKSEIPTTTNLDFSQKFMQECNCPSKLCRGHIY